MQGCRPGREPGIPGRLTSAVDAPAHSALSTRLAARGRRRDQHRGGRTAPGIPGGAKSSGGQSGGWFPAPNGAADWFRRETITRLGAVALKGQRLLRAEVGRG